MFGGYFIVVDGDFTYRKKSQSHTTSYWICTNKGCTSKGTLDKATDSFVVFGTTHNHQARELRLRKKPHKPYEKPIKKSLFVGKEYELIKSDKSCNLIGHGGFLYRQDKEQTDTGQRYWRCLVVGCKARAKTKDSGDLTLVMSEHSHGPDPDQLERRQLRAALQIEAIISDKPAKEIFTAYNVQDNSLKQYFRSIRRSRVSSRGVSDITPAEVLETAPLLEMDLPPQDEEGFNIETLMMETLKENFNSLT